jgi:hypothetical protein
VNRRSLVALVFGLVALASVACQEIGIDVPTATPPSGIRGLALLGPTCPVGNPESPGADDPVPCLTPYAAPLVVTDSEGAVVARTNSGADGRFQVNLPPGEYVVTPATGQNTYPIAQPVSVTVGPGAYVDVEINYDTGIR